MTASNERKAFKNWFDHEAARALAEQIGSAHPSFDQGAFLRAATEDLNALEFNARVAQFADALATTLPADVPRALKILTASLPAPLPDCEAVTDGWLQWPIGHFIGTYGVDHYSASMSAMIELTQRFSAEFAVRPFAERYTDETLEELTRLTTHPSPHVRRWCSEGLRPRLPWGRRLQFLIDDPSPVWPILEALKDDPELYVRRSVANHLNDIAKDHPELVVERCLQWSTDASTERMWVIKHALRSLIKAGDPGALAVMGYHPPRDLEATLSVQPTSIEIGESVELEAIVHSSSDQAQDLLIDYVVHYVRKGDKVSAKVFKWKTLRLDALGKQSLTKRHSMRVTTIRALYPGTHRVELQINGARVAEASFVLR
ncbi:MAG: DNA alkylation repair protein [Acidobacteriota bacterium]